MIGKFIYLKGTPKKDLLFKEDNKLKFEVYVDVGQAGSMMEKRLTTRYYTELIHAHKRLIMSMNSNRKTKIFNV